MKGEFFSSERRVSITSELGGVQKHTDHNPVRWSTGERLGNSIEVDAYAQRGREEPGFRGYLAKLGMPQGGAEQVGEYGIVAGNQERS